MADDYFTRLPIELQWRIFEYALVVPYRPVHGEGWRICSQGICIIDGKTEFPFDTSLFMVNRRISILSRTICYSRNRFILGGDCQKSLKWIQSQPQDLLLMIRRLDLLVTPAQFLFTQSLQGWDELVASIPIYFELGALCLSIDACRVYPNLAEYERWREDDPFKRHAWMMPLFETLLQPFQTHCAKLVELKDLFVFYPQYRSQEFRLEKIVKGKHYDSISRGKVDLSNRAWKMIHGWEWSLWNDSGWPYVDNDDWYEDTIIDVEEEVSPPSPERKDIRDVTWWKYMGYRNMGWKDGKPEGIVLA